MFSSESRDVKIPPSCSSDSSTTLSSTSPLSASPKLQNGRPTAGGPYARCALFNSAEAQSTRLSAQHNQLHVAQSALDLPQTPTVRSFLNTLPHHSSISNLSYYSNSIPQPDAPPLQPLDPLSARTYLSSALSQFLGVTGTAIPIDILKVENKGSSSKSSDRNIEKYDCVWIRVPRDDGAAVVAAISSWIGGSGIDNGAAWRVCAKGNFLGALVSGSGSDLFVP